MRRSIRAIALVASATLLAACSGSAPTWTYPPVAAGQAAASPGAAPSGEAVAGSVLDTLVIEAFELGFTPAELEVPAAGRYAIELRNTGGIEHDITFPGGEMAVAAAGASATVEVDVPAEGLEFLCSIPGHAQGGGYSCTKLVCV
jgi:nitrite reductase (NO-forming)